MIDAAGRSGHRARMGRARVIEARAARAAARARAQARGYASYVGPRAGCGHKGGGGGLEDTKRTLGKNALDGAVFSQLRAAPHCAQNEPCDGSPQALQDTFERLRRSRWRRRHQGARAQEAGRHRQGRRGVGAGSGQLHAASWVESADVPERRYTYAPQLQSRQTTPCRWRAPDRGTRRPSARLRRGSPPLPPIALRPWNGRRRTPWWWAYPHVLPRRDAVEIFGAPASVATLEVMTAFDGCGASNPPVSRSYRLTSFAVAHAHGGQQIEARRRRRRRRFRRFCQSSAVAEIGDGGDISVGVVVLGRLRLAETQPRRRSSIRALLARTVLVHAGMATVRREAGRLGRPLQLVDDVKSDPPAPHARSDRPRRTVLEVPRGWRRRADEEYVGRRRRTAGHRCRLTAQRPDRTSRHHRHWPPLTRSYPPPRQIHS